MQQKLVPDLFIILVNNPKQPLHVRNYFKSTIFEQGLSKSLKKGNFIFFFQTQSLSIGTQSLILHEMLTFTKCLTLGKLRECKDILRTNELQKMKIEKFSFQNFKFPCFLGKYNSSYWCLLLRQFRMLIVTLEKKKWGGEILELLSC